MGDPRLYWQLDNPTQAQAMESVRLRRIGHISCQRDIYSGTLTDAETIIPQPLQPELGTAQFAPTPPEMEYLLQVGWELDY
jgi:hypothetical protein